MTVSINKALIAALRGDTGILTALGGAHVFARHHAGVQKIPGVYLTLNGESSKRRPGFNAAPAFRIRDNRSTIQLDIFDNRTAALADGIADAVDAAIFKADITGTRSWERVSRTEQYENDTGLHHIAARYQFAYSI